jgi:uncharacterized protein
MQTGLHSYCWRRVDQHGLEQLRLEVGERGIAGHATIIDCGPDPFVRLAWALDADWRSKSLRAALEKGPDLKSLRIERGDGGWIVDGAQRPDLAECDEIDVSATPFCNTLAIRAARAESARELSALYVDAAELTVQPSRQRYERLGPRQWRYLDLGVARGFTAVLDLDESGLVTAYEGLFARI